MSSNEGRFRDPQPDWETIGRTLACMFLPTKTGFANGTRLREAATGRQNTQSVSAAFHDRIALGRQVPSRYLRLPNRLLPSLLSSRRAGLLGSCTDEGLRAPERYDEKASWVRVLTKINSSPI